MFEITIPEFIRILRNLSKILDKASEHANNRNFDDSILLDARLAPDQLNLIRQVQLATDRAKCCAPIKIWTGYFLRSEGVSVSSAQICQIWGAERDSNGPAPENGLGSLIQGPTPRRWTPSAC